MTSQEKAREIVENMTILPDDRERFSYIISFGRKADGLPPELKREEYRIDGCQSLLWLVPSFRDGSCHYGADSDAMITKGISAILCHVYSGASPEEILAQDTGFLQEAGVTQHLSPNRSNGLSQISKRIHDFARACLESKSHPQEDASGRARR